MRLLTALILLVTANAYGQDFCARSDKYLIRHAVEGEANKEDVFSGAISLCRKGNKFVFKLGDKTGVYTIGERREEESESAKGYLKESFRCGEYAVVIIHARPVDVQVIHMIASERRYDSYMFETEDLPAVKCKGGPQTLKEQMGQRAKASTGSTLKADKYMHAEGKEKSNVTGDISLHRDGDAFIFEREGKTKTLKIDSHNKRQANGHVEEKYICEKGDYEIAITQSRPVKVLVKYTRLYGASYTFYAKGSEGEEVKEVKEIKEPGPGENPEMARMRAEAVRQKRYEDSVKTEQEGLKYREALKESLKQNAEKNIQNRRQYLADSLNKNNPYKNNPPWLHCDAAPGFDLQHFLAGARYIDMPQLNDDMVTCNFKFNIDDEGRLIDVRDIQLSMYDGSPLAYSGNVISKIAEAVKQNLAASPAWIANYQAIVQDTGVFLARYTSGDCSCNMVLLRKGNSTQQPVVDNRPDIEVLSHRADDANNINVELVNNKKTAVTYVAMAITFYDGSGQKAKVVTWNTSNLAAHEKRTVPVPVDAKYVHLENKVEITQVY